MQSGKKDIITDMTAASPDFESPRPEYLTAQQLAHMFQTSPSWVYEKSQSGELPAMKLGGMWRYDLGQVHGYLDNCHNQERRKPSSPPRTPKRTLRHLKPKPDARDCEDSDHTAGPPQEDQQ